MGNISHRSRLGARKVVFGLFFAVVLVLVAPAGAQTGGLPDLPEAPDFILADQRGLLDAYREAMLANLEQQNTYIATVNEKYIGALERAREKMIKLGATRAIAAIDGEVGRIQAGNTARSEEVEEAPDYVREMRGEYDQFIARVAKLRHSRDAEARVAVDNGFSKLQVELTKANQLDRALAIRDYRALLRRPPAEARPPGPKPEPEDRPEVTPPGPEDPLPVPRPPFRPPRVPDVPEVTPPDARWESDDSVPRPLTPEEVAKVGGQLGPKPTREGAGYTAMVESIRRREVTEITLGKIKSWGAARPKLWKGKPYWTATVSYPTTSLFGTFDTEGIAIIDGNRVLGWYYTGSGEEIP